MSRSYRKPYSKAGCDKRGKAFANKKIRRTKNIPKRKGYKKIFESWIICDFKFYNPNDKKIRRK